MRAKVEIEESPVEPDRLDGENPFPYRPPIP
jgi:hypothetical protein